MSVSDDRGLTESGTSDRGVSARALADPASERSGRQRRPCHTRDPKWITKDLLWEYLHEKHHEIYEIVINPDHTYPKDEEQEVKSKIPWNQRAPAFIKFMETMHVHDPSIACGSAVKIFLHRYMKTYPPTGQPRADPFYRTVPESKKCRDIVLDKREIRKGFEYIKGLLRKGIAVRIPLLNTKGQFFLDPYNRRRIAAGHYVGIVGYDGGSELLYVDPWPGWSGVYKYAGQDSMFLGVMEYNDDMLKPKQVDDYVAIGAPTK